MQRSRDEADTLEHYARIERSIVIVEIKDREMGLVIPHVHVDADRLRAAKVRADHVFRDLGILGTIGLFAIDPFQFRVAGASQFGDLHKLFDFVHWSVS